MSMNIRHMQKPDKPIPVEESEIYRQLAEMEQDPGLKTEPGYVNAAIPFSDLLSFSEKHMTYLRTHPKVNALNYLSNLRTMIKIRHQ
jgi:hypothetical protein